MLNDRILDNTTHCKLRMRVGLQSIGRQKYRIHAHSERDSGFGSSYTSSENSSQQFKLHLPPLNGAPLADIRVPCAWRRYISKTEATLDWDILCLFTVVSRRTRMSGALEPHSMLSSSLLSDRDVGTLENGPRIGRESRRPGIHICRA